VAREELTADFEAADGAAERLGQPSRFASRPDVERD
jgi:hypothetical protein